MKASVVVRVKSLPAASEWSRLKVDGVAKKMRWLKMELLYWDGLPLEVKCPLPAVGVTWLPHHGVATGTG